MNIPDQFYDDSLLGELKLQRLSFATIRYDQFVNQARLQEEGSCSSASSEISNLESLDLVAPQQIVKSATTWTNSAQISHEFWPDALYSW